MKFKRIFLLVLDSLGVGEAVDAINFKDNGANTLGHILESNDLFIPNLKKIGFIDTLNMSENDEVEAYYTIAKPTNAGKDSLNGHYEIVGLKNDFPFRTFNDGFTYDILSGINLSLFDSGVLSICIAVFNNEKILLKELLAVFISKIPLIPL